MQSNIAIAQRGKGNDRKINAFGKVGKLFAYRRNFKIGKRPNDGLKKMQEGEKQKRTYQKL